VSRSNLAPQHRSATRTSKLQWAMYATSAALTAAATLDSTCPKWQAVLMGIAVGAAVATAVRDGWWRKEIDRTSPGEVKHGGDLYI